jgi:rhodanese-related sulfurtransferase
MCGKNLSSDTFSTIGDQRANNYALQFIGSEAGRERFIAELTAGQPSAPAYFAWDATFNRQERETLDQAVERASRPLPLDEVLRRKNAGAVLLDVRDPAVYAAEHLSGSTNIGLGGRFASWCGTVLERERPIVVIAEPGREGEAVVRLGRIGFDQVVGFLVGGPAVFAGRTELTSAHPRIEPLDLARRLEGENPPLVLDVRTPTEWEAGHVDGSLNAPLDRLDEAVADLSRDRALAVHCQTGYRSSVAASRLEQLGFGDLADLEGGWVAWEASRAAGGTASAAGS